MADQRARVLTMVFTDLADSTALKSQRGDEAVGELISRHREHVTRLAEECSGRIIDWAGDGCFLTFETSTAGVLFALRLQHAHDDESDLPGVRIGIHLGEITEKPNPEGDEAHPRVEGLAVDVAARVSGLAKPGQVLMSSAVYNSARQRMGVEAMGMPLLWQLHGTYALKGFDTPLDIGEAGIKGVAPLEAPKVGDKARLVRKAKKQPEVYRDSSRTGVPTWAFGVVVMALMGIIVYLFLGRPPAPAVSLPADARIESIAVLPFENYSQDASQDYFVNGMTDTLTAELAKIDSIKVMARTSAMRYKNTDKLPDQIARELGVQGLIEGSIQRSGDEVRITAQLIDGRTSEHVWAGNFEGTVENILRLQGEVAIAIAEELDAVLAPEEREEYEQARSVNTGAWELYLQAREAFRPRTVEGIGRAIDLLKGAVASDPDFAGAHALLGLVHAVRPLNGNEKTNSGDFELAQEHAERALALNPNSVEAHLALAWAAVPGRWDWQAFDRHIRAALDIDPNNGYAFFVRSYYFALTGHNQQQREALERAIELDPFYPLFHWSLGGHFQAFGRFDEALAANRRALEVSPDSTAPAKNIAWIFAWQGKTEEALAAIPAAGDISAQDRLHTLANLYARLGMQKEATEALNERARRFDVLDFPLPVDALALLGREDDALDNFEHSISNHAIGALNQISRIGQSTTLWENPRIWEIYARANFPDFSPEHPAYVHQQRWLADEAAKRVLAAQPKPVRRYAVDVGPDFPLAPLSGFRTPVMAASPDGSKFAYVSTNAGHRQLILRERDRLEMRALPGTEGAAQPVFSPDGSQVAFFAENQWKVTAIAGGTPKTIIRTDYSTAAAWCDDGSLIIAGGLRVGLARYSPTGEKIEQLTTIPADSDDAVHAMPDALPGGKGVVYAVSTQPNIESTRVEVLSFKTGEIVQIATEASVPKYVSTGHIIYVQSGALMAVPFSVAEFRLLGPPVQINEPGLAEQGTIPSTYAIADDGTFWYGTVAANVNLYNAVWVDHSGKEEITSLAARPPYPWPHLSPDGTQLLVDDGYDVFSLYLQNGVSRRLSFDARAERWPIWGPTGKNVFYIAYQDGFTLMKRPADGTGAPKAIFQTEHLFVPSDWSRDGRYCVGHQFVGATSDDIVMVDTSDGTVTSLVDDPGGQYEPRISPDGNWIAYSSIETGQSEVYVRPFPSLDGKWQITESGGGSAIWDPDMSRMFYMNEGTLYAVPVGVEPTFTFGRAEALFTGRYILGIGSDTSMAISPDGERFLLQKPVEIENGARQLVVVENWFEELKRLAPHPAAN